MVEVIV